MKRRTRIEVPPAIPITLGIVGHRDAIITDKHRELINSLFDDLHINYPKSPLYLFSQLAEGADCDIADMFLENKVKNKRGDDALIAPIPFEAKAYEKTFGSHQHVKRFRELAAQSKRHFVLEAKKDSDITPEGLFRAGGKFIADSSVILIVLWDGIDNGKIGGAADIVYYKEKGAFNEKDLRNIYEKKSTILSLRCNRASGEQTEIPYPERRLLAEIRKDSTIADALRKIEELNSAAVNTTEKDIKQSLEYLLEERDDMTLEQTMLASYYCLADDQALKNQTWYRRMVGGLFVFGMLIIIFFEIYKHFWTTRTGLSIPLVLILLALTGSWITKKREHHPRFLAARVIAESLRVQFFWNMVGLRDNAAEHILKIYRKDYEWVKYILNGIYGITYPGKPVWKPDLVTKHWLAGQLHYFSRNITKVKDKLTYWNTVSRISLYLALITLSIMFIFHPCLEETMIWGVSAIDYLIIISGILLGAFALPKAYVEKRAFHQLQNQDALMEGIFKATIDRLESVNNANREAKQDLFLQAGLQALIENGNWYLIYKDKEPSAEVGG